MRLRHEPVGRVVKGTRVVIGATPDDRVGRAGVRKADGEQAWWLQSRVTLGCQFWTYAMPASDWAGGRSTAPSASSASASTRLSGMPTARPPGAGRWT